MTIPAKIPPITPIRAEAWIAVDRGVAQTLEITL